MSVNLDINENCCVFIVLKIKEIQTIIAIITESKVIELFCMVDDFCKFFDTLMSKYTLKPVMRYSYHHSSIRLKAEIMFIMILFLYSDYHCLMYFSDFYAVSEQLCIVCQL